MAEKVKLSKDGSSIDFVQSESIPTSVKKFRQSPEIEGFYRFIYENDLQKEAYEILERIVTLRKAKKKLEKQEAAPKKVETKKAEVVQKAPAIKKKSLEAAKKPAPTKTQAPKKAAPVKKTAVKATAKKPKAAPKKAPKKKK